jgi:hypothetical protein
MAEAVVDEFIDKVQAAQDKRIDNLKTKLAL